MPKLPKVKRSKGQDWSYSHRKDILGIVMVEIKVCAPRLAAGGAGQGSWSCDADLLLAFVDPLVR